MSRPSPEPSVREVESGLRGRRWIPLGLLAVVLALYGNSLGNGFHFDDSHSIESNPFLRDLRHLPAFFTDPNTTTTLRENRDLRPVLLVTFALNHALAGPDGWSFHLVNILLHGLAVLLVFHLARNHLWLGRHRDLLATAAALLVAVHPLNSEPVNYISSRSALLTAVFYLGSFGTALRGARLASLLLLLLGVLTKLTAITLPLALLVYAAIDRTPAARRADPDRPPFRDFPLIAALATVAAGGVLYRLWLLPPHVYETARQTGVTTWTYFLTQWSAYLYYLRLWIWPDALAVDRVDYPWATSLLDLQAWGSLLGLLLLAFLAWRAGKRWAAVPFAFLWYGLTLSVESSFLPLAEPVNEHRPYLAMLGIGTASAIFLREVTGVLSRFLPRKAASLYPVLVGSLAVALSLVTLGRNRIWADDYELWLDNTRKAPKNSRAWLNAGHAAMVQRRDDEARALLLEAYRLSPCYAYVHMNLSALERRNGQLDKALEWAEAGVRCQPELALTHQYLGAALAPLGRTEEALAAYTRATEIDPYFSDCHHERGRLLERQAQWRPAAEAFDRAAVTNPQNADSAMAAGLLWHHRLQDPARAVERYRAVLRLRPTHYGAHFQLALALHAVGDLEAARRAWTAFVPLAEAIGDQNSLRLAPDELRSPPSP